MDLHERAWLSFYWYMSHSANLDQNLTACLRCPRLVEYRQRIAHQKRRAYRNDDYWGKPVPGFGDEQAQMMIVGLAPGAHGANRSGRMFTGDRSGDFLFSALFHAGFASQPYSTHREDGLQLNNIYISNIVRCVPPGNLPLKGEVLNCRMYLISEIQSLLRLKIILSLGKFAWDNTFNTLAEMGIEIPRPRPAFAHGAEITLNNYYVHACYHPSQRNTSTHLLTTQMMHEILASIKNRYSI